MKKIFQLKVDTLTDILSVRSVNPYFTYCIEPDVDEFFSPLYNSWVIRGHMNNFINKSFMSFNRKFVKGLLVFLPLYVNLLF